VDNLPCLKSIPQVALWILPVDVYRIPSYQEVTSPWKLVNIYESKQGFRYGQAISVPYFIPTLLGLTGYHLYLEIFFKKEGSDLNPESLSFCPKEVELTQKRCFS